MVNAAFRVTWTHNDDVCHTIEAQQYVVGGGKIVESGFNLVALRDSMLNDEMKERVLLV